MPDTMTALFEDRTLCPHAIAQQLLRIGDSAEPTDRILRNALLELLRVRAELAEAEALLNCLEGLGLQTLSPAFGIHSIITPYRRESERKKWFAWQGHQHSTIRAALRETIQLLKSKAT